MARWFEVTREEGKIPMVTVDARAAAAIAVFALISLLLAIAS